MPSSIKCKNCGSDIVVEMLSPGQVMKCGSCGAENLVSHMAESESPVESVQKSVPPKPDLSGLDKPPAPYAQQGDVTKTAVVFRPIADMRRDLRNWGIGLIGIGIVSIVFSEILDPIWGGLLIVLGVLTLIIRQRGMYIAIGLGLLLAGIMNIAGSIQTELAAGREWFSVWAIFGLFQIFIGIQELRKFWRYA